MKQTVYLLIGLLAGLILAGALLLVTQRPSGEPVKLLPAPTQPAITIQILGAVVHPGVYTFSEGSRVQDALNAAGGLLSTADTSSLNLVARLEDGQQLNVPSGGGFGSASSGPSAPFVVLTTPTVPAQSLINLNTATLSELETLPGIGPTTAQKILDYRTQHGPFQNISDLLNVPGIGPVTFDTIKAYITAP